MKKIAVVAASVGWAEAEKVITGFQVGGEANVEFTESEEKKLGKALKRKEAAPRAGGGGRDGRPTKQGRGGYGGGYSGGYSGNYSPQPGHEHPPPRGPRGQYQHTRPFGPPGRQGHFHGECFKCGRYGHMATECGKDQAQPQRALRAPY